MSAQNYHQVVHFRHRITTRKGGNSINNTTRIYGEDINGNVKAYFVIDEDKEELIVSQKRTDKQLKYLNDKDELRRHNNKLGGFILTKLNLFLLTLLFLISIIFF